MEPKVWTKNEIIEVVEKTISETLVDARDRGIRWSKQDLAEMIYFELNEKGLVNFEP